MKKQLSINASLFTKALGGVFLILALFAGTVYLIVAILFNVKNVYPYDYFGLPETIAAGVIFLLAALGSFGAIILGKKKAIPMLFLISSLISFAFLMLTFLVVLGKMKVGGNESFFITVKLAFSFFILGECAMIILSSVVPFLFIRRGYFNFMLHTVAYIVEAILWVVLFILMITRVSPASGFLLIAFLFLRTAMYWWLLIAKQEPGIAGLAK